MIWRESTFFYYLWVLLASHNWKQTSETHKWHTKQTSLLRVIINCSYSVVIIWRESYPKANMWQLPSAALPPPTASAMASTACILHILTLALFICSPLSESIHFNFPVVFNFGDSNSDTGELIASGIESINPPYGQSYFHKPSGRYCDGRLIIDFLSNFFLSHQVFCLFILLFISTLFSLSVFPCFHLCFQGFTVSLILSLMFFLFLFCF